MRAPLYFKATHIPSPIKIKIVFFLVMLSLKRYTLSKIPSPMSSNGWNNCKQQQNWLKTNMHTHIYKINKYLTSTRMAVLFRMLKPLSILVSLSMKLTYWRDEGKKERHEFKSKYECEWRPKREIVKEKKVKIL